MRRGFTILEVITACGLLGVLMLLCIQVLSLVTVERRHVERRAIALQEAANLLEQVAALPYADVDETQLSQLGLAPEVKTLLPDGQATVRIAHESDDLPGKQIQVEIDWNGPAGRRVPPVRLTSWLWPPPAEVAP